MSEWWTYAPSDFLMFSPRVYYRLFEFYNRSFWPVAVVSLSLGIGMFLLLLRPTRVGHRIIPLILGALWVWIAWAFFLERYATINWGAVYLAPVFGLQGVALLWTGAVGGKIRFIPDRTLPDVIALALFLFSAIGYPFVAAVMGRSWLSAEIFGLAPDPTALATLALLALAHGGIRWPLLIIPFIWCLLGGLTLWTMDAGDFFIAPASALSALVIAVIRARRQSKA
jgi:Family of unknown function (DUF6064)